MTPDKFSETKKILIVDDEQGVLDMLRVMLEDAGYAIVCAHNGEEGLQKAIRERPNLIISDILMPVIDGFIFYKNLKKEKATEKIPVLILTARGQMEDSFKAVGVDDFVEKPSERSVLLQKIEGLINRPSVRSRPEIIPRVLVAGTDKSVVENMVMQLQNYQCNVEFVFTGPDIIVKSVNFRPNMIIMEIQMEGIRSSSDVIRAVRLLPQSKMIPILVYSFYHIGDLGIYEFHQKTKTVDQCTRRCLRAGATEYIGHFKESHFLDSLRQYLV